MSQFKLTLQRLGLLVFFASSVSFAGPGRDVFIRDSEILSEASIDYLELREIALRMFAKCPPSECLYVGIGQSPTPILALLEAVTGQKTVQIPLSNVRQLHNYADPDIFSAVDRGMRKHLREYLDPADSRKILITDFVATTAASMTFAYSAIKVFYPKNKVYGYAMTAFGHDSRDISVNRLEAVHIDYWHMSPDLYKRIHERQYKSLQRTSKYDVMKLAKPEYEPVPAQDDARFQLLVDAFRRLARDDLRFRDYIPVRIGLANTCRTILESPRSLLLQRAQR